MTDQELRDKLASEYADGLPESCRFAYQAGWNAARANPPNDEINKLIQEKFDLIARLDFAYKTIIELQRELKNPRLSK